MSFFYELNLNNEEKTHNKWQIYEFIIKISYILIKFAEKTKKGSIINKYYAHNDKSRQ